MQFTSTWQPGNEDIFADITSFFDYLDGKYGKEATHEALTKAVKGNTLKDIKQIVYEVLGTNDNKEIKVWAESQGLTVNLRIKASWQSILDAYHKQALETMVDMLPIKEMSATPEPEELVIIDVVQPNTEAAVVELAPVKKVRKPRKSKKAA